MARGPRKTVDDQIREIDEKIAKAQNKVNELKKQREQFETKKKNESIGQLYDLLQNSGKSIDEIKDMLSN